MKDKFVKFVVQRRTLYAIVALVTVMALTIAFFPATPPAKVAHAQTNILSYWNFNRGDSDCIGYSRVFPGADTSAVKPYVYTPTSWDFSKGGWYYCTHAQHYVSTTNGSYCGLDGSTNDTIRGDWCVFVEYLGSQTFGTTGQYMGNTIRVTQWEGAYYLDSSGLTPEQRVAWDVVEEWYLQENRGIVEIR